MNLPLKLNVKAGNHGRDNCPVFLELFQEDIDESKSLILTDENNNKISPDVINENGNLKIFWIINSLKSGEERNYTLSSISEKENENSKVNLIQKEKKIDVNINNNYFTSYVYDSDIAKPYLGPIKTANGKSWTRLDFETEEHPHHRSLWVAIGDVNGNDFWNEPEGEYGKQRTQDFTRIQSGVNMGIIKTNNVWMNFKEEPLVDETREIYFYNISEKNKIIDLQIIFKANYGRVEFGPTKEAGPLGIRMSRPLRVDNGGKIINSYGSFNEEECWGKRAEWCDYYGQIQDEKMGIATFDNPDNDKFPTHWHIRDYGLMAPNNFYFIGGKTLKPDTTLKYNYRVYFHLGDTKKAGVRNQYQNYINPPEIEIIN
ncbi:MAG: PmoA family protein [Bacillota bacterium]